MVNKRLVFPVLLIVSLLSLAPVSQAGSMGTSNADFLRITPGAGPAGMGSAYTALAQDVYATFWNPAGLASMDGRQITFMHLAWFESLNYEFLAYAQSLNQGQGIGAHVIYFWTPDFNSTEDEAGLIQDSTAGKMYDLSLGISYGYDLGYSYVMRGRTSIGAALKGINRQLMNRTAQSVGLDLGMLVEAENGLTVGITALNIGSEIAGEQSPFTIKLGLGYSTALATQDHHLRCAVDLIKPIDFGYWEDHSWKTYVGAEYLLLQSFALRIGYQTGEDTAGITAGIGARYGVLQLDYAFAPYTLLGYTHRVSISVNFPHLYSEKELSAIKNVMPELNPREEDLSVIP